MPWKLTGKEPCSHWNSFSALVHHFLNSSKIWNFHTICSQYINMHVITYMVNLLYLFGSSTGYDDALLGHIRRHDQIYWIYQCYWVTLWTSLELLGISPDSSHRKFRIEASLLHFKVDEVIEVSVQIQVIWVLEHKWRGKMHSLLHIRNRPCGSVDFRDRCNTHLQMLGQQ